MPAASTARAEFLKAAERFATSTDATLLARWGTAAGDTSQSTPLVEKAAADAEAARQLALLSAGLAEDRVVVEGLRWDLEGEVVQVDYSHPDGGTYFGGAASVAMLVTRARPNLADGTTELQGLIQL